MPKEKPLTLGRILEQWRKERIEHEGKGILGLSEFYNKWKIKAIVNHEIPGDVYMCGRCNSLSLDRFRWYFVLPIPKKLNEYLYIPIDRCWFCENEYK